MKKILIIILACLFICGCSESNKDKIEKLMEENEYIIIDVRTKEEYDEGHLVDAINIPHNEINEQTNLDKDKLIFVYCKSGNRSSYAYAILNNLGYEVYDLGAFSEIDLPKE